MSSRRSTPAVAEAPPARSVWRRWSTAALAAALVAVACLVYAPVRHYDFVEIDDPLYVSENPHLSGGLSADNLRWAFTHQHGGYWIPLTWISYMADVEIFGNLDANGHHVTNLVLHVANTLILFGLLRRATGAPVRSAFVAALFAVHPLHVESVAWITERKDVLSTLFWFLGLWAYAWHVARPNWRRYGVIVACVALGLLAKPMLVTFPFVLLLMDVWPLKRVRIEAALSWAAWRPLIVEKLPLLALVPAASAITYLAQQQAGAASPLELVPMGLRLQNAVVSYAAYLWAMVWPARLSVIYPLPPVIPGAVVAGSALVLLAISAGVWRAARRWPYLPVGWLWYLGTMVPVIGIVQVGIQARADRFTYVPLVGIFVMIVWACADAAGKSPRRRGALVAAGLVLVTASAVQAREQLGYWQNSVTLWTRALECTLGVSKYDAHRSLGRILAGQKRLAEAVGHYEAALTLNPSAADVRYEFASVLAQAGRPADAVVQLREVIRARPDMVQAHAQLGLLLSNGGQIDEAIREYEQALRLKPDLGGVHNNIGTLLAQQGRTAEALPHFEEAARHGPDVEVARVNQGLALARLGRLPEARAVFIEVLQQHPRNEVARRAIEELPGR